MFVGILVMFRGCEAAGAWQEGEVRAMRERTYVTPYGSIRYWVSESVIPDAPWVVLLPGLTADHRLFDQQLSFLDGRANCFVWDPPGHGSSRPYSLIDLKHWAQLLHEILEKEGVASPVLVGQSMGGYTAQMIMELFPGFVRGFVSIDSAPLQRSYYKRWELWSLKHTLLMFKSFPWKMLVKAVVDGVAVTEHGRRVMREIMLQYGKSGYCELAAAGYKTLAEAIEEDHPFVIGCPVLILCGEHDGAALTKKYNEKWAAKSGFPFKWVPNASHNANVDNPEFVNLEIWSFVEGLSA